MNGLDRTSGKVTLLDSEALTKSERNDTPFIVRYKPITNLTNVDRKPAQML